MGEVCDLALVVFLERLERQVLADRQGLLASGVRGEDLPAFHVERERLMSALVAEPQESTLDPAEQELRRALRVM